MTTGNILLIDDDPALLEALRDTVHFQLPKTEVHALGSLKPALERLKTQRFSAIISDMRMPDMTGLELLRQAQQVQPDAPFLLITGRGDRELADEAFRAGAFDFIQKPFDRWTFIASLKMAFNASRLRTRMHARQSTLKKLSRLLRTHEEMARQPLAVGNIYTLCSLKRGIGLSRSSVEMIRTRYEICRHLLARDTETLTGIIQNSWRHAWQRLC